MYFYQNLKLIFSPPAHAELMFRRLTDNQSLELSCSPQQEHGSLTGFHLYHRSAQSQTTLLSMAEGGGLRVDPDHRGRLQLCGGLDSLQLNVTISHLQPSDTGLYMWELSYREGGSDLVILSAQKLFLLVEGTGMWRRHLTIQCLHFAAVKPKYLCSDSNVCWCLRCREAMPLLPQLPPSALDHLYSSRAASAHSQLAGRREMCEYLHFKYCFTQQRCRFNLMGHF